MQVLDRIHDGENYLSKIVFSDETTFHINGCVYHYGRVYGEQQPNEVFEYARDLPEGNVWFVLVQDCVMFLCFLC